MTAAVVIENLEWKYEHTTEFALRGINLEIPEKSFLGVVGPNEQGKTTLVSAISGLIPHSFNGIYRGLVKIFGEEVKTADAVHLASQVGLVFADPESQFTAMTVEEELVFGLENLGFSYEKIKKRLEWAAEITMISDLLDKSPYDVSGGQKQRMAIACVLAMNPRIIILDEPTSMIDPLGKQFIFDILRNLKEAGEHTLIVVEHNIEQLAPLADQLLLMHQGQIARLAPPEDFFEDPEFLLERGLYVPEVTVLAHWLRKKGRLTSDQPLPLSLTEAIHLVQNTLTSTRQGA